MKHIGLFEGIGGFSLAAKWMNWNTIAWCEIDPFCQKVLNYHFPNAEKHGDIKQTDFSIYRGQCDILTGGFPCQPYSSAGKRLGKEDERHLFPEMLRTIREIKPRWIVGENVNGLLTWNGGLVFGEVCADLENEGYEVQSFVIPACAVNAPHRRDRVWIVANANSERYSRITEAHRSIGAERIGRILPNFRYDRDEIRCEVNGCSTVASNAAISDDGQFIREQDTRQKPKLGNGTIKNDASNATSERLQEGLFQSRNIKQSVSEQKQSGRCRNSRENAWHDFPTQSAVCGRDDGISERLDGIAFSKWRRESVKAFGNAIVPQVAYEIFKAIQKMEDYAL